MPVERDWVQNWYVSMTDLSDGSTFATQFLPAEFEETLEVGYNRITVPGLSHQPQQYAYTGNQTYSMELYFRAKNPEDISWLQDARKFLQKICYPREGSDSVITGAPARVLFNWPSMVSMTCILTSVSFRHFQFSVEGYTVAFTARITLEEIRDVRLLAEDVELLGTLRGRREDYPEYLEGWDQVPVEELPVTGPDGEIVE